MSEAEALERCLASGGVAVFPADTVYGLCCDPQDRLAVTRLYLLKRRELAKPSAVMFFDLDLALAELQWLGERTQAALRHLLPGGVSLLLPNPERRYRLACGRDPDTIGLRVPHVPMLRGLRRPVLQSSANRSGAADPRRLEDVPALLKACVDLVIDGGELPGTPSTVVDLRRYEQTGTWSVVRQGAVPEQVLRRALEPQFHFEPAGYREMMMEEVPDYELLQDEAVRASGSGARRILELGTGTGETARRMLDRHPEASLLGIDRSDEMLGAARAALAAERVTLRVGDLEDPLPRGPFDLVLSSLCVHHLAGPGKADLFARARAVLAPGGRIVIADVVVPEDPTLARTPLTHGFDKPSTVDEQLLWLEQAGFRARISWQRGDLAVLIGDLPHG